MKQAEKKVIPLTSAATHQDRLAQLRLMQLISPSLPIGSFTYSQGLEWAVEHQWVSSRATLSQWLAELIETTLTKVDLPLLLRLYDASENNDAKSLEHWSHFLLACRETSELRMEESNRGRALATLLKTLELEHSAEWYAILRLTQSGGFAHAASQWNIPAADMLLGFSWAWLETLVLAGVKIIPLGQSDGQRLMLELAELLPPAVEIALQLKDEEIGASNPALSIASSQHQFQYTRIFRS